jgi:hypothetical protein
MRGFAAQDSALREHGADYWCIVTDLTSQESISARVSPIPHSRVCGSADATAAMNAPTDCGALACQSLRLRSSCLCVCASADLPRQTSADCPGARGVTPSFQLPSLRLRTALSIGTVIQFSHDRFRGQDAVRHRLRSDSVPVAETSETRSKVMLTAFARAVRVSS